MNGFVRHIGISKTHFRHPHDSLFVLQKQASKCDFSAFPRIIGGQLRHLFGLLGSYFAILPLHQGRSGGYACDDAIEINYSVHSFAHGTVPDDFEWRGAQQGFAQSGRTLVVALNGRDSNPGSETQPLRTIQRAADLSLPGDTILVRGGQHTYYPHSGAAWRIHGQVAQMPGSQHHSRQCLLFQPPDAPHDWRRANHRWQLHHHRYVSPTAGRHNHRLHRQHTD
jgi:hypothetical protein